MPDILISKELRAITAADLSLLSRAMDMEARGRVPKDALLPPMKVMLMLVSDCD